MRKLTERAIKALPRQSSEQIKAIVNDLVDGNRVLETVLSSLPSGIMVSDINHDLIFINTQARRFLKLSGNDFLEKKIWKAVHDGDISDYIRKNLLCTLNPSGTYIRRNPQSRTMLFQKN